MTTIEKLLRVYKGRLGLSPPPELRKVYGKRLTKITDLTSIFLDCESCTEYEAYALCYQLVVVKLRWRRARNLIGQCSTAASRNPHLRKELYARLYSELTALAEQPQETLE